MTENSLPYSYDQLPYASYPYANSHPRNLAALAQLFGMTPAGLDRCRVLEIGCAAGGNLIPMAERLPDATFVGLDASARQISEGQKVIGDLSLGNITLAHQDIMEFDAGAGKFDYIICHGVYSWVPPQVQNKIMDVCRDHLADNGIAYISYNTYPGWYLRRGVREMMSYHASGFKDTQHKIDQSRALVDFLASAVKPHADAYEKLLHEELSILRSSEDSYIFHEHLEDHNEPVFFHEFVSRAESRDLRFLCEAQFGSMMANDYSEETRKTLAMIAPDMIQMEQYLDFLRNRKFRQTLLCHRDVKLDRNIKPERLRNLYVNAPLIRRLESESDDVGGTERPEYIFDHASGQTLTVANPIQKFALEHLAELWPSDESIERLADIAFDQIPVEARPEREGCRQELYETFLELFSANLVSLNVGPSGCVPGIGSAPRTSPLVRYQAERGSAVTNQRHETVRLDEFEREIVQRLDGSQTIDGLTAQLLELSVTLETESTDEGESGQAKTPSHDELRSVIENRLTRLANTGLLVPDRQVDG
ncbi:MAG: class I SAM-dependent methyltransferase [Planctomycetales bacterium]|nr:class I SAM-dependent methyltransferase [Planctomycetales bacterium]